MLVVRQLGLGLVVGIALAVAATWLFARLPASVGPFAPVASLAAAAFSFGAADVIGGSGFLAVYLVGLAIGSTPSRYRRQLVGFHEGIAFLAQVTLFIVLGLLVFPRELTDVAGSGLALALLLVFVVRPVAVWVSTALNDFSGRERLLLGWAGLRGAVPIVLATFVLSSRRRQREHDLQRRLLRRRRLGHLAGNDARTCRGTTRPSFTGSPVPRATDRGRRVEPARSSRFRGRTRSRNRGCGGQRGGPPANRDHRRRRSGRQLDPTSGQHDHRAGRPPLRPRPAFGAPRGRRRLLSLAAEGLERRARLASRPLWIRCIRVVKGFAAPCERRSLVEHLHEEVTPWKPPPAIAFR